MHLEWGSEDVTVIGRIGRGPGEYQGIGWLYPLAGDSTLFTDRYNGRWNLLHGARIVGTRSETRPLNRQLTAMLSGTDEHGQILGVRGYTATGYASRHHADSLVLLVADRVSQRVDTVAHLKGQGFTRTQIVPSRGGPTSVFANTPLAAEDQALLFADGWIAVARLQPYRVDWRAPDGRWIRGAPLPWTDIRVDDREKCAAMPRSFSGDRCNPSLLKGWPETIPPFLPEPSPGLRSALFAAPDGCLVIDRTPTADSRESRYDVVDRQGRLAGTITLDANAMIIGFGPKSIYVLVTDEWDLQTSRRHPWP